MHASLTGRLPCTLSAASDSRFLTRHPDLSNSQRFNTLPPRSNHTQKVIDTHYTFLLYFLVYPESHPRLLALSLEVFTLLASRLAGSPEGLVSLQFAPPLLLFTDNCPLTCLDPVGVTAHHPTKLFRINTYGLSRKCGKQRTCRITKSFRIRTYKKQGGGGVMVNQIPDKGICPEEHRDEGPLFTPNQASTPKS
jgi:hypothetical protein